MNPQPVDTELVARARQGDRRAFDLLVLRYQQRVAHLIARYIRDSNETLDITQEVFIKAYRAIGSFRGESAFYTWLYRIAINTAKNYLVARSRRPPCEDIELTLAEQLDRASHLKDYATPESVLISEELAHTVQRGLAALPEDLRTALMLRELEGMSYEEIAEAMSCPIGTVRSRIFRAREAINKCLNPLLHS